MRPCVCVFVYQGDKTKPSISVILAASTKKESSSVVWLFLMMRLSGVMSTLLDHIANYPLSSPNPPALTMKSFNTSCELLKNLRSKTLRKSHEIVRTLFCWGPAQSGLQDKYHLSWMNFPITQLNQTSAQIPNPPPCSFLSSGFKHNLYKQKDLCILHMLFLFCLNKGISSMGLQSDHLTAL